MHTALIVALLPAVLASLAWSVPQPAQGFCAGTDPFRVLRSESEQMAGCVFQSEDPVRGGHFLLAIEDRRTGKILPVRLPGAVTAAVNLVVSGRTLALLGTTQAGGHVVALVDGKTGFLEWRRSDTPPRVTDEGRYVSFTQATGTITLDLAALSPLEGWDPVANSARLLRDGTLEEKWRVLTVLEHNAPLRSDPRLEEALIAEATRVIAGRGGVTSRARVAAAALPSQEEVARLAYRNALLVQAAATGNPRVIPLLVRAELMATRPANVAAFGERAVPELLAVLRSPAPAGYPREYRSGLMRALVQIAEESRGKLTQDIEQALTAAARETLARETDWRVLREAIALSESFDDPALITQVERLTSRAELRARGISSIDAVGAVQDAAHAVLGRRMTIR